MSVTTISGHKCIEFKSTAASLKFDFVMFIFVIAIPRGKLHMRITSF